MKKLKVLMLITLSVFLITGLLVLGNKILNKVGEKIVENSNPNNYKTKTLEILKEKYGEEFAIKQTGGNFGATRNTRKLVCYPVNNPNDSFNVEVKRDLSKVYDEYFNRIMEHKLEDLLVPYAQEVFGNEVVVKSYLEGMFYEHTSLDISVQEYLKENTPPMLLYVFIKSNGENFTVKDCENMSLFLEQLAKYDFIDEPSTSFFLVKPEAYESVEEEFYKQMENENVWPFYLDKEKIITAGDFEIREGKVTVGIDDINNELQRIKELIW